MSLATRCPECSTTFQVVPDQLRISDGWVRCGRCSRVFDANDHMVDLSPPMAAGPAIAEDAPENDSPADDDLPWSAAPANSASWERLPSLDLGEIKAPERVDPSWSPADFEAGLRKPVVPETVAQPVPLVSLVPPESDVARREPDADPVGDMGGSEHFVVRMPSESSSANAGHERHDPQAGESDFSFLGTPVDSALERRRRIWRRVALVVLALAAIVVLAAQVLAQSHDAFVARQPALRPAVLAWCRLAGCTVSPLRKIDDITIDGSAFARQKGDDGYLLSFTLRNRSELPLAMPAIELSLLDTQERAVLRRVLRPSDFGAPLVLSAHGEHSATLPLALAPSQVEALQPLIVGYHLDPFYP